MILNSPDIYQKLLQAIGNAQKFLINKNCDDQQLFADLLTNLLDLSQSSYGFIGKVLYNSEKKPYFRCFVLKNNFSSEQNKKSLPFDLSLKKNNSLIEYCVESAKNVIINNFSEPKQTIGLPEPTILNNFLGIPFISKGKVIGMFGIGNKKENYTQQIIDFLEPLTLTCTTIFETINHIEQNHQADLLKQDLLKKEQLLNQSLEHKKKRLTQSLQIMIDLKNRNAEIKNQLSSMIDSTSDIMFSLDKNYCLTIFNKTFNELASTSAKSPKIGSDVRDFIPKSIFTQTTRIYEQVLTEKKVVYDISKIIGKKKFNYWEVMYNPIFNKFDEIEGVAIHGRNIMDRILAEQRLKENEQRLREAQLSAKMGSWEYIFEQKKVLLSTEIYEIFGIPENYGDRIKDFIPFLDKESLQTLTKTTSNLKQNGQSWDLEMKLFTPKGEEKFVRFTGKGIYKNNVLLKAIGMMQDITERKQEEEEKASLLENLLQKNNDLAKFANLTAHNLRRPLANILGLIELWQLTSTPEDFKAKIPDFVNTCAKELDKVFHQMIDILTKKHLESIE